MFSLSALISFVGANPRFSTLKKSRILTCPSCEENALFPIFKQRPALDVLSDPGINTNAIYFTACPRCAAVYQIKSSAGRMAERWPDFKLEQKYLNKAQSKFVDK